MANSISHIQHAEQQDALIELFTIDASNVGGAVYNFTPEDTDAISIVYAGIPYTPFPIRLESLAYNTSDSAPPRPNLIVGNVNNIIQGAVINNSDLVGAEVTRIRTFARFLDNGISPDPTARLATDSFIIQTKSALKRDQIAFKLSLFIDSLGLQLPRRQVLKTLFPGVASTRVIR